MNTCKKTVLSTSAIALAIGALHAAPAAAQSGGDVVVMRRVIAPPNRAATPTPAPAPTASPTPAPTPTAIPTPEPTPSPTPVPSPTPTPTPKPVPPPAAWAYGDWVFRDTSACTTAAVQTRTAVCMAGGAEVEAGRCGEREDVTRSVERLEGCTRAWHEAASAWSSLCSTAAIRTDVWTCLRSDGQTVPDAECSGSGPKPTPIVQGPQFGACTYRWATTEYVWSSKCSDSAVQTRTVTCQRRPSADGGDVGVIADLPDRSLCAGDGPEPAAVTAPAQNVSQCDYDWTYTAYGWDGVADAYSSTCSRQAQQTRTASCWRHVPLTQPTTGKVVTDEAALCSPNPAVTSRLSGQYGSCTDAIANGDFENFTPSPWTGARGVSCGNAGSGAAGSGCFATIVQNGTMSLAVTGLDVGSAYTFAMYGASGTNVANTETITVTMTSAAGAAQSAVHQFAGNAGLSPTNQWSTQFLATSKSMTLSIKPTAGGLAKVDGISLNIVPQ